MSGDVEPCTAELQGTNWLRIFGKGERAGQLLAELSVSDVLEAIRTGKLEAAYLRGDLTKR